MALITGIIYFISVIIAWLTVNGWAFVFTVISGALFLFWVSVYGFEY